MDFILENLYVLIFVAAGIAQWVNSQREAMKTEMEAQRRREQPQPQQLEEEDDFFGPDFDFDEAQENLEREAERRAPAAATPPPLPSTATVTSSGPLPGVERSPVPSLLRRNPAPHVEITTAPSHFEAELARQAEMLEQVRVFKQATTARSLEDAAALKASAAYGPVATVRDAGGAGLRARLRNRRELKQAIVLKEILEKPVGLRN